IAGAHTGVSVGPDGGTHQALEDIAITRCLPNLVVLAPCDSVETKKATIAAARFNGPVYFRFTREKTPVMTLPETPFEIGKAQVFKEGKDVVLIGCGPVLYNGYKAAVELEKEGLSVMVVNSPSIKPLDEHTVLQAAKSCGAVVTLEEHQIMGGFGSAVAEFLAKKLPVPIEFVGVNDRFGESGTPEELIKHFGLGLESIKHALRAAYARKK
ncbi:MAG TPA: transketolase C-terminal domain-containing protein, partial [Patescibacteria group bacterium]|nr:transketolase C-terminal domain-containing protein [Patescibacteria group bacterium]